MDAQSKFSPGPPIGGAAIYIGDVHLGFVIQRARGFDAVNLGSDLGRFNTSDDAARALIALAAPTCGEDE